MKTSTIFSINEIEHRICDLTAEQLDMPRREVERTSRFIEDLRIDSLDLIELLMSIEEEFDVTLPDDPPNSIYKAVFTRSPFRIADVAEMVYLQQGTGTPQRTGWRMTLPKLLPTHTVPFTQLSGRWDREPGVEPPLFESIEHEGNTKQYRRQSDGMRCVLIPSATVEIGSDSPQALPDERPMHKVEISEFVIDAEPVSTTAYCRFLNSIEVYDENVLGRWILLDPSDDRNVHLPIRCVDGTWEPIAGTERWPMILVSWHGANAYSLWANGRECLLDLQDTDQTERFLPTEAQWEYAAHGSGFQTFPWGNEPASPERMTYGLHRKGMSYDLSSLPLSYVNDERGMSNFGLHHMAGNVWHWCSDWYEADWYGRSDSGTRDPVNRRVSGIRSERGGSWVGPADLCRSSYRRGRPPHAFGRCLGFRCVSRLDELPKRVAKKKWSMFGN